MTNNSEFKLVHINVQGKEVKYPTAKSHTKLKKITENKNNIKLSEKNNFKSTIEWFLGLINPLNHLPIVSTLNKAMDHFSNSSDKEQKESTESKENTKNKDKTDMVQSAVGGYLFGGHFGLISGIGGWLVKHIFLAENKNPSEEVVKTKDNTKNTNIKDENIDIISKTTEENNLNSTSNHTSMSSRSINFDHIRDIAPSYPWDNITTQGQNLKSKEQKLDNELSSSNLMKDTKVNNIIISKKLNIYSMLKKDNSPNNLGINYKA